MQKFYCVGAREENFKILFEGVSSFAIFGMCVSLCELQMCLHLTSNHGNSDISIIGVSIISTLSESEPRGKAQSIASDRASFSISF